MIDSSMMSTLVLIVLGLVVALTGLGAALAGRWWGSLIPWAIASVLLLGQGEGKFVAMLSLPVLPIALLLWLAGTNPDTGRLTSKTRGTALILGLVALGFTIILGAKTN